MNSYFQIQFEHSLTEVNVRGTKLCICFAICCDGIKSPAKPVTSVWSISIIIVEDGKPRGRYTLTVLPVVHVPVIVCRSPCAAALWVKHFNEPHLCQGSQCWQWCCVAGSVLGPSWIHWCLCSAAHEREKMTQRCIGVRVRVRKWMAYGVLPRRQINSSYLLCNPWSISAHLGKKTL